MLTGTDGVRQDAVADRRSKHRPTPDSLAQRVNAETSCQKFYPVSRSAFPVRRHHGEAHVINRQTHYRHFSTRTGFRIVTLEPKA
jgi:hypothetical protein